jgi:hypothetical protein
MPWSRDVFSKIEESKINPFWEKLGSKPPVFHLYSITRVYSVFSIDHHKLRSRSTGTTGTGRSVMISVQAWEKFTPYRRSGETCV